MSAYEQPRDYDEFEATTLDDLDAPQRQSSGPRGPYEAAAMTYLRAGWEPLPLLDRRHPEKRWVKADPPSGWTGRQGLSPSAADVYGWIEDRGERNVALRLPTGVIGIDVDHYQKIKDDGTVEVKRGGDTLAELEALLGPLPPTWRSTSRDDGVSGIRLFRAPEGLRWPSVFGAGIECIRREHRYTVVWPSVHPETGVTYKWIDPSGIPQIGVMPSPAQLPELPAAWVEHFTHGEADVDRPKASLTSGQAWAWITEYGQGDPCRVVRSTVDKALTQRVPGEARHDAMLRITNTLAFCAAEGHPGVLTALEHVRATFIDSITDRAQPDEAAAEYGRAVDGAIAAAVEAHPQPCLSDPCCDPIGQQLAGLVAPADLPQTVAAAIRSVPSAPVAADQPTSTFDMDRTAFWESRPELAHIRDFARARLTAPWAVLGCVLTQVTGRIEPNVVLPPTIGGDASLNLFVGLVGTSGTGKGAAEATARDAFAYGVPGIVGNDLLELNAGSGEGIASTYQKFVPGKGKDDLGEVRQHETRALFRIAEVDALAALKGRSGSTLLTELRDAWSGDALGFAYVDQTRRLPLKPHSYRLNLVVGVQPGRAAVLLDDADGGTPQRFLWLPTRDYGIPDVTPPLPDPRVWSHPWAPMPSGLGPSRMTMPVCRAATDAIHAAAIARHRGQVDALDGHALLCRLKVAAGLAVLRGGLEVVDEDWDLAGVVMTISDYTRESIKRTLTKRHEDTVKARGRSDAIREAAGNEVRLEEATRRISRAVQRHLTGEWTGHNVVKKWLASRDRDSLEDAISRLIDAGIVEATTTNQGPGGRQYRLANGVRA